MQTGVELGEVTTTLLSWGIPLVVVTFTVALTAIVLSRTLLSRTRDNLTRQLIYGVLGLLTPVALILALPFGVETRGQLLSLFGLVVTAVIALASTSTVSNVMAGLTLRGIDNLRVGDFIQIGEHFGRVTERGLLHTEIQSTDRDLITLPNLYVAQNPAKVVRSSGTLVSSDVSIGYDVHRSVVADALMEAAESAQLTDGFVQITELGNFAVHYRVSGFLGEVTNLVSKRSELKAKVLDTLHAAGIEIMSPSVMAQRPLPGDLTLMPDGKVHTVETHATGQAEQLMFDKADLAAKIEQFQADYDRLVAEIAELEDAEEDNSHRIRWRNRQLDSLKQILDTLAQGRKV